MLTARRLGIALAAPVLGLGLVLAPAVAVPEAVPQAQAQNEDVQNSSSSSRSITVRIWPGGGVSFDRIVGPGSGVNAGTDRISSYYIPAGVCASVNRGGVNIGTKKGPLRTYMAQAERIHVYTWSARNGVC